VHRFDRWQDIVNASTEGMIERGTASGTEVDEFRMGSPHDRQRATVCVEMKEAAT
jgi:hypothetical protein